ncbi:hypothetical protein PUN28_018071 [Cardiocondyla obscurior]|uniref:Uncharacterized protein n=1 Tax=Cardiocondyla obscurior TaxID=286306 RepID=A0AAW2EJV2_9HYME
MHFPPSLPRTIFTVPAAHYVLWIRLHTLLTACIRLHLEIAYERASRTKCPETIENRESKRETSRINRTDPTWGRFRDRYKKPLTLSYVIFCHLNTSRQLRYYVVSDIEIYIQRRRSDLYFFASVTRSSPYSCVFATMLAPSRWSASAICSTIARVREFLPFFSFFFSRGLMMHS